MNKLLRAKTRLAGGHKAPTIYLGFKTFKMPGLSSGSTRTACLKSTLSFLRSAQGKFMFISAATDLII